MAMQNTLALPELLENIISHLPERDILCRAQRVSRNWKNIIDSSPGIQRKIWLQPIEQTAISPAGFDEDDLKIFAGAPIYPRTTLISPLLRSQDPSNTHLKLSLDFFISMKPMELYGEPPKSAGCSHFRPNLTMAPPKNYEEIKAYNKAMPSQVPTWRNVYLSEPPVTTAMLMVSYYYQAPPDSRNLFKVLIRDKIGVTMGLVYDTLAATMPIYDESLESPDGPGAVQAHVCWFETGDGGGRENDSEVDASEDDGDEEANSEEGSGEDDDEDSEDVKFIKLHLQVLEQLKSTWGHKAADSTSDDQSVVQQTDDTTELEARD